ncbi:MAG: hypothetical protein IKF39_04060 [Oscillospiraceae bacterium]|nr:hypothetical protein [Oscillospiraceae bacterium]
MTDVKIGGRTIPLSYTAYEMIEIQRQIGCTAFELTDKVFGIESREDENNPDADPQISINVVNDPERLAKMGKLIAILGNAGLEQKGETPDLTDKWVLRNMKPALILGYAIATMAEINEGNMMEVRNDKDGPVDETLEAEQAKKPEGN